MKGSGHALADPGDWVFASKSNAALLRENFIGIALLVSMICSSTGIKPRLDRSLKMYLDIPIASQEI